MERSANHGSGLASARRRLRSIVPAFAIVALAASQPARAEPPAAKPPPNTAAPASVIGCASLANLRIAQRRGNDDPAAVMAIVTDRKSDLGCSTIDRAAVTGITEHVSLDGHGYDCVGLQTTSFCHWTLAGAIGPLKPASDSPSAKAKR